MRKARQYVMHEFPAKTWDELGYMGGTDADRHFRMVTSYWEMVAGIVNQGLIDEELFFDSQGEGLFVWTRVRHLMPEARRQFRPTYLWNLERMARRERTYPTAERVIEAGSKLASAPARKARAVASTTTKKAKKRE
jgi:hypothetical protein